ncbi:Mtr3 [Carabus blaptoides fortunei]
MPIDYKRINGPDNSEPYHFYSSTAKKSNREIFDELYSRAQRIDGRKPDELRKIYMKTGVVSQAKGSAYIELQKTKVIVSVFDPREIPNKNDYSANGELYCEFKFATFSCRKRRSHQQDNEEKQYSVVLRRALEPAVCRHEFPNFQVDIYALVLENDGSALAAAITCAGLALAHAGVPMYDLVTAVTLGIQNDKLFMDPTMKEEIVCNVSVPTNQTMETEQKSKEFNEHGIIILAMLATHEQISELYQTGYLSLEAITNAIALLTEANKHIVLLAKKCLVKHVIKHIKDKKMEEDLDANEDKCL